MNTKRMQSMNGCAAHLNDAPSQVIKNKDTGAACPDVNTPPHDCYDHAVPYKSDGPIGHGWECGICKNFLQAG